MNKWKLAAFDLDGTLADTLPMCIVAFGEAVSPYAGHTLSQEEITETFGLNEKGMVNAILTEHRDEAIAAYYRIYREMQERSPNRPFPGVVPLLEELKARGLSVVLITGKSETSCYITLEALGLEGMFDQVLTGSEFGVCKAQQLRELMEQYGLKPEECFYVGDTVADARASREAGVVCYSAAWSPGTPVALLERTNPGQVCGTIAELRQRLGL